MDPSRRVRCDLGYRWIHQNSPNLRNLAWQLGYEAFSIGISQVPATVQYIERQQEHRHTRTFKEEYLAFLKWHDGNADEKHPGN
ncbi:MAG: transposase [Verrucomicrobia bacterium]|nr:transposase [Verrucomicrobiota bacterium]